jgi:hypothetical protein
MLFDTQFQYFVLIPVKFYSLKKYLTFEKWNGTLRMKLRFSPKTTQRITLLLCRPPAQELLVMGRKERGLRIPYFFSSNK